MGGPRPLDLSTGAALVRACVGVWGLEGVLPGEAWRAMADLLPVKLRLRPKATFWEGGSGTGAGGHVNWGPPASAEESRSVQRHLSDLVRGPSFEGEGCMQWPQGFGQRATVALQLAMDSIYSAVDAGGVGCGC